MVEHNECLTRITVAYYWYYSQHGGEYRRKRWWCIIYSGGVPFLSNLRWNSTVVAHSLPLSKRNLRTWPTRVSIDLRFFFGDTLIFSDYVQHLTYFVPGYDPIMYNECVLGTSTTELQQQLLQQQQQPKHLQYSCSSSSSNSSGQQVLF